MEQTEGKVNAYACVFVCVCVLEGRAEEGTRRRQFRDGTRVGRETLAGMGGPAGGLQGFEGSLEGGAGNKKGMCGGDVEQGRYDWGKRWSGAGNWE